MKRRQFSAMLATATFSLGGLSSVAADASAQETEPLEVENVSVRFGGVTATVGRARLALNDGTMQFQLRDWSMEGRGKSVAVQRASIDVADVDAETFATVRSGLTEAVTGRSAAPLLTALAEADVSPDSGVRVSLRSVEADGRLAADRVTATGTVGGVVPEGTRGLVQGGLSIREALALGASEWRTVRVQRADSELTAKDVTIQREGSAVSVSSPSGSATVSGRSFAFEEMGMTVESPETIPQPHVEFASRARQLAREGSLTVSALQSAASESGVTVSNTAEAVRSAPFDLSFANVTEDGQSVVSNFSTTGTLGELMQVLQSRL